MLGSFAARCATGCKATPARACARARHACQPRRETCIFPPQRTGERPAGGPAAMQQALEPSPRPAARSRSRRRPDPLRIACWSGPRNISTAMMRAWAKRSDTAVCDEPLYAHYLAETGADHPGGDEVVESGDCDWRSVVRQLTGPVPGGKRIWYQKHMTHHLLPEIARGWLRQVLNCFLIRDPRQVLLSYSRTRIPDAAEDLGFPQQVEI